MASSPRFPRPRYPVSNTRVRSGLVLRCRIKRVPLTARGLWASLNFRRRNGTGPTRPDSRYVTDARRILFAFIIQG
jgi:hypothetical protein